MLLDRLGPPGRCSGCGRRLRAAAATLSATGSASPRPDRTSWLGGLRRAFSPAFRAGSLYPLARGCRRIWRGEKWLRRRAGGALTSFVTLARARAFSKFSVPARCCSTGSGRLGGAAAAGGGRDALSYGVSFATTRSHQLARGAPACFLSGISGWFSLSLGACVGAEESGAAKNGFGAATGGVNLLCHPRARARAFSKFSVPA